MPKVERLALKTLFRNALRATRSTVLLAIIQRMVAVHPKPSGQRASVAVR